MNILFRADASVEIGTGHLMRCLTLADQLRGEEAEVAFICRDLPGAMFDFLCTHEYRFAKLPVADASKVSQQTDAAETIDAARQLFPGGIDWLVVDHYRLDMVWQRLLRPHTEKLMVIDDLANRQHDCDLLLDQNYYQDMERRYEGMVPPKCITLLGPNYVLLRPEFVKARRNLRMREGVVRRILIFFGGSDATNQTRKALDAIKLINNPDVFVDVVVGAANPQRNEIESQCCEMPNTQFHCQVSNMSDLIAAADIAVGAGGATTWERCALGLPTLTIVFADNQLQTTLDLERIGVTEFLGWADTITAADLARAIEHLIEAPARLKSFSERAKDIMREWQGAEAITSTMKIFRSKKRIYR